MTRTHPFFDGEKHPAPQIDDLSPAAALPLGEVELLGAHLGAATELAEKILEVAGQEKADLIIMGTHGTGGIGHIFLGSVSQKVLHRAVCPVMLVRHSADE